MRHALGVLGVCAAGVLLAVSAAMNWRFGFQLGRTDFDGHILGAASAAADCFKALVPFFFFAAIRNRMWAQALAAAVVGIVVTGYSLTSAIGMAALTRSDTTAARAVEAQSFADVHGDMERAKSQLGWIPQHRPSATVESEIAGLKAKRDWNWSNACTDVKAKSNSDFCQKVHALEAEHASALQAAALEGRIAQYEQKLGGVAGKTSVTAEADPQAKLFSELTGFSKDKVQMGLALFVALLLEIGSGFGMFVAFSQWRLYDRKVPVAPALNVIATPVVPVARMPLVQPKARPLANDNRSTPKQLAEETDVQRFHKERITTQDGSTLTTMELWESYCAWCEDKNQEPLALPTFGREFGELGITKAKIAGKVRFIGIGLKSAQKGTGDNKHPAFRSEAA